VVNRRIIAVVICFVLAFALSGYLGEATIPKSYAVFGLLGIIALLAGYWLDSIRHHSPRFVSATVHGSIDDYLLIDKWAVIPLGSAKATGWYQRGGEGTVVVPNEYVWWVGNNLVSLTCPEPCDLDDLPPAVVPYIESDSDFKKPYYFAREPMNPLYKNFPIDKQDFDVKQLLAENIALNRLVNGLRKVVGDKESFIEKNIGRLIGFHKSLEKPSLFERVKRVAKTEEEE